MMAVSRISTLCALLTIFAMLLAQVLATPSPSLATTPKTWLNYIWSTPTTTSVNSIPSFTEMPDGSDESMPSASYYAKTFIRIDDPPNAAPVPNPDLGVTSVRSTLMSWLSLPSRYAPFNFAFLNRKVDVAQKPANVSSKEADSLYKPTWQDLWKPDAEDHTHETKKEKAQRKLDCAMFGRMISKDAIDPQRTSEAEYLATFREAFMKHGRKGCDEFAETTGASPLSPASASKTPDQVNSKLPSTPAEAVDETRLQTFTRLAEELSLALAGLLRTTIIFVIVVPPILFLLDLSALYCDGEGFQPGEAADTVIEIFMVEGFYAVVVHAPYTYLRRKILSCYAAVKAWVPPRKVDDRKEKDALLVSAQAQGGRRGKRAQVQSWLRSMRSEAPEFKTKENDENGEWLLVDKDDAGDSDEEYVR